MDNAAPIVYETHRTSTARTAGRGGDAALTGPLLDRDPSAREPIDAAEIFELVRDVADPEHPFTLEQLHVVAQDQIEVDDERGRVSLRFTPTVAHCSMATLIGLCLTTTLQAALPPRFRVDVAITEGAHSTEAAINKQLADKERVAAAMENPNLAGMVAKCLAGVEGGKREDD